jgi:hypothetical protein
MNAEFRQLRTRAEQTKKEAQLAENALNRAINSCPHDWSDGKYDPKITPGGSYEPSGAGSDWRPGGSYAETREHRWSRTCSICGTTEYTTQAEPVISAQKPKFRN